MLQAELPDSGGNFRVSSQRPGFLHGIMVRIPSSTLLPAMPENAIHALAVSATAIFQASPLRASPDDTGTNEEHIA